MTKAIAILTADIHASHKPPIARTAEPSWYDCMKRYFDQLFDMQKYHTVPIICAGDLFHHWNEPVELVNFLLENIPEPFYSIRGNHDLPHHQNKDVRKSAYWTLKKAGIIKELDEITPLAIGDFHFYGMGYDRKLNKFPIHSSKINVAVVHKYVWNTEKNSFPGAPVENLCSKLMGELNNYQIIVTGDNHKPFEAYVKYRKFEQQLFNCGALIPRNSDQQDYKPSVGILYDNRIIKRKYLDTSKDKWLPQKEIKVKEEADLSNLLKDFKDLSNKTINFFEILEEEIKKVGMNSACRETLSNILEEIK